MAAGKEKHQSKIIRLQEIGKPLVRRCKSKCEICDASGTTLTIFEVPPLDEFPCIERALMLCDDCRLPLEKPKLFSKNPEHWRCLTKSVWSEIPAVQVVCLRALRILSPNYPWAAELLEATFFDEQIINWADEVK